MEKSRIFIASSSSTLVFAEALRDKLQKDGCDAVLWTDTDRCQLGLSSIDMLQEIAQEVDLIVITLDKHELSTGETENSLQARDYLTFEAGFFMGVIGAERCLLVGAAATEDLPPPLTGIRFIRLEELNDLNDCSECTQAIESVTMSLADTLKRLGKSPYHIRVPTLSGAALWQREKPKPHGDLEWGEVVVCDRQPTPDEELAVQVRRNLDQGLRYTYFLHFSVDTIDKVCHLLQVAAGVGIVSDEQAKDSDFRMDVVRNQKERVLDGLRAICKERKLQVALLPNEPSFIFRIHNASSEDLACVYVRYADKWFIPWAQGPVVQSIWKSLPRYLAEEGEASLFVSLKSLGLNDVELKNFEVQLEYSIGLYFPGIEDEIKQICIGSKS